MAKPLEASPKNIDYDTPKLLFDVIIFGECLERKPRRMDIVPKIGCPCFYYDPPWYGGFSKVKIEPSDSESGPETLGNRVPPEEKQFPWPRPKKAIGFD